MHEIKQDSTFPFQYSSPEGILFVSDTPTWNHEKLKALYQAFKPSIKGEERKALKRIVVTKESVNMPLGATIMRINLDPKTGKPINLLNDAEIVLFYGDQITSIETINLTLSHEYGHLFTYYWMILKEQKFPDDQKTKWASHRGIQQHPDVRWRNSALPNSHLWSPSEIMADDFVILFGSPVGKSKLVRDPQDFYYNSTYVSLIENQSIPPVASLPNVQTYWESLAKLKPTLSSLLQPKMKSLGLSPTQDPYNPIYTFTFTPATTSPQRLSYLMAIGQQGGEHHFNLYQSPISSSPVFTLPHQDIQPAFYGSKVFVKVYALHPLSQKIVYSEAVWFDATNPFQPILLQESKKTVKPPVKRISKKVASKLKKAPIPPKKK
ncbi:hypothetical protein ACFYKX_11560 [Cytobacillus sp. FJAT-54145]|uniref:Uncharacterized protein n=1 Tax=Cytobacillus spartinae TaxID=3299023 RepID=A0ABW6KAJ1_9BACI